MLSAEISETVTAPVPSISGRDGRTKNSRTEIAISLTPPETVISTSHGMKACMKSDFQ
jgi:hypothetical protein